MGHWPSLSRGAAWTGELMCCGGGVGGCVGTASVVTSGKMEANRRKKCCFGLFVAASRG